MMKKKERRNANERSGANTFVSSPQKTDAQSSLIWMATHPKHSSFGFWWLKMALHAVAHCSFGSAILVMSSHLFFYSPICLAWRAAWEAEKGLLRCECCSATAKPQCVINIILVTQPKHCI